VLTVCTGNICRSPMAEALLRAGLAARLPEQEAARVEVSSAGTHGYEGAPMEPHARTALAALGVDGEQFRARALVAEHVEGADLVLAATREHRAAAVLLDPSAAGRTFTLRELARLTAGVEALPGEDVVARGHALVAAAAGARGTLRPSRPGDDDVADPYRARLKAFSACAAVVAEALQGPLDLLAGVPGRLDSRR
jgi:protein-tyrosine phosphatase